MSLTIYKRNDQVLNLPNLRSGVNDADKRTAAIVTATLYDPSGNVVAGLENIVFSYVPPNDPTNPTGLEGLYRGLIPSSFDSPVGSGYSLLVKADDAGEHFEETIRVSVKINKG